MKWLVVIGAVLLAQCLAMPVEDQAEDVCEDHMSYEMCEALKPLPLDEMVDGDSRVKRQMGDDLLEKLIWEKLKIFAWIIGKIGGSNAEQFVRNFIEQNRDAVTQALKQGGFNLINLLGQIVGGFLG